MLNIEQKSLSTMVVYFDLLNRFLTMSLGARLLFLLDDWQVGKRRKESLWRNEIGSHLISYLRRFWKLEDFFWQDQYEWKEGCDVSGAGGGGF